MTTPLASEPMPGDGQVPHMSALVDRLYQRLPEVYRNQDARDSTWSLKRYLGGMLTQAGTIWDDILRITGEDPVGPATPEPWALPPDQLERWRSNRVRAVSALGDPMAADAAWLPWLAQMVGAPLDPAATEMEKRDTIAFATSGWRGGTRQAIADAARTALTDTKYANVIPHMKAAPGGGLTEGTVWDVTIVTRGQETPDPDAVLGAVLRKGVKPAGVVLWNTTYQVSWDTIEAIYPMWSDWEALTWDQLQTAGLRYAPVPGNAIPNPSFEVDSTGWTGGAGSTVGRVTGGVDGVGMERVTRVGAGSGVLVSPDIPITSGSAHFSFSVRPDITRDVSYTLAFYNGSTHIAGQDFTKTYPATTNDVWFRAGQGEVVPVPATTTKMIATVTVTGMGAGELYDVDAFYARSI